MERQPCVYNLARASHSTLYAGVTSDLLARIHQHRAGIVRGFTKHYGIKRLVWFETHDTMELVRRIAKDLTILIVEHDMQVVMELAQRITVLHYGEILAEGTPAEIQQNPRVLEVYLKT